MFVNYYGHIPQQTKPKAEWISNSVQCVFLGNESKDGKYYKLLNLQTLKIIRSRTAIFEEERFYKDLPDAQLDSIVFEMPNDSIDDMVQPARRSGANRYYMRNLPQLIIAIVKQTFLRKLFGLVMSLFLNIILKLFLVMNLNNGNWQWTVKNLRWIKTILLLFANSLKEGKPFL